MKRIYIKGDYVEEKNISTQIIMKKDYWKQDKPRYEITWKNISNGKRVTKKTFTWKRAIEIALDARHGTLLEKAVTDKVSIVDTESGEETII